MVTILKFNNYPHSKNSIKSFLNFLEFLNGPHNSLLNFNIVTILKVIINIKNFKKYSTNTIKCDKIKKAKNDYKNTKEVK